MVLKTVRYISLVLLVLWMGVIFAFSAQAGEESSEVSRGVVVKVAEIIYPNYESLNESQKVEVIQKFYIPVRKIAHFSEFFVLGAISFVFFATFKRLPPKILPLIPFLFGVLYAISDEIHQWFIDGRACSIVDILIDSSGVLFAVFIGFLINLKIRGDRVE